MDEKDKQHHQREVDPATQEELVEGHDFDGIRELDNDPPFWLSMIFLVTVLIAYTYFAKYHIFHAGPSSAEQYEDQMAPYVKKSEETETKVAKKEPEKPLEPFKDQADITAGSKIFSTNCVVCHAPGGAGLVGPNLTDQYWLHGGSFKDIVHTITYGYPVKGMISWQGQISKQQILQVASYIMTLQGTHPANPKPPQGEKYVPEVQK